MDRARFSEQGILFIEPPSQDYYCPVCYELLIHPYQTRCCGNHLCRECCCQLESTASVCCPVCRKPGIEVVEDKFFIRLVHSLRVYCHHHRAGCGWEGELRDLPSHVDVSRGLCEYVLIMCGRKCGQEVRRGKLREHETEECSKRPKTCEHCSYHNAYDIVLKKHYPICEEFPVECPNQCGTRLQERLKRMFQTRKFSRRQLREHLRTTCPLQEIDCKYAYVGCSARLVRVKMPAHLQEAMSSHIRLLEDSLCASQKELASLKQTLCELQGVHADSVVQPSAPSLHVDEQYLINIPPVTLEMTRVSFRKNKKEAWFSPPFYSMGHKLQLKVYTNGYWTGEDTHLSIYVHVMRGENDDSLQWPLIADVTLDLLSWNEDTDSHSATLYLPGDGYCQQVVDGERAAWAHCLPKFISHSSLDKYLRNDCLRIRVKKIVPHTSATVQKIPSWQVGTCLSGYLSAVTITHFSKCQSLHACVYSEPFYTHQGGYKIHLRVHTNGVRTGKGTHISVQAALMKGKHDQSLQWPFQGDVEFKFLNWKEDSNHQTAVISFLGEDQHCRPVVMEEVAMYGYCMYKVLPHSILSYDHSTNTQYVQNDCLHLVVKDVAVYSIPLIHEVPRWQNSSSQSLCDFTLTKFFQRKRLNNVYYTPIFSTHKLGYNMRLEVYSNGLGLGWESHISVCARLAKGEYDSSLQWPFHATVTVEILNWNEDKNHHAYPICFDKSAGDACDRVTSGEFGTGWGVETFLAHSVLSSTNTAFVYKDCLRFRARITLHFQPV